MKSFRPATCSITCNIREWNRAGSREAWCCRRSRHAAVYQPEECWWCVNTHGTVHESLMEDSHILNMWPNKNQSHHGLCIPPPALEMWLWVFEWGFKASFTPSRRENVRLTLCSSRPVKPTAQHVNLDPTHSQTAYLLTVFGSTASKPSRTVTVSTDSSGHLERPSPPWRSGLTMRCYETSGTGPVPVQIPVRVQNNITDDWNTGCGAALRRLLCRMRTDCVSPSVGGEDGAEGGAVLMLLMLLLLPLMWMEAASAWFSSTPTPC